MTRATVLASVLDRLLEGDASGATTELDAGFDAAPDPWALALGAFVLFMALDYIGAVGLADRALLAAGTHVGRDPDAVLTARAVRGLASAGARFPTPGEQDTWTATAPGLTPSGDPLADAAAELDALDVLGPDSATAHFARYLTAEASLACGRLDLAAAVVERIGKVPLFLPDADGAPHGWVAMMHVMRARLYAFRAMIPQASAELKAIPKQRRPTVMGLAISGTETLVRGNATERGEARALADRLELARLRPVDYLSVGCYLLAAFGLSAVGDVRRSARLALFAGTASLDLLSIVDRGLTLELLVASAADEGDLDAAEAWRERAEPLLDDPIACSSIARLTARVELLAGRPASALPWAERSVELARAEGRIVELLGGQALVERARALLGTAFAPTADPIATGVRSSRAGGLRATGRRVRPAPGSDWQGLSVRERDIALMVAEGLTNREIGHELFLSEHTVRAHVSRVLAAFGAASRFAVAARVAELFPAVLAADEPLAELTPRQEAVAERIAHGLGNAEIGRDLDLSVKTVEKHIGEIFRRWNVTSRVGIARIVRSRQHA